MIGYAHIDRHLKKLELKDYEPSFRRGSKDGNMIFTLFPSLNFDMIRERVWDKKYYFNAIDLNKSTSDKLYCKIVDYYDGYDIVCDLIFERDGTGCKIEQSLKYIESYDSSGKLKPIMSFVELDKIRKRGE